MSRACFISADDDDDSADQFLLMNFSFTFNKQLIHSIIVDIFSSFPSRVAA